MAIDALPATYSVYSCENDHNSGGPLPVGNFLIEHWLCMYRFFVSLVPAVAVLGIALIAMGEDIGADMCLRAFGHLVRGHTCQFYPHTQYGVL